jgi:hypothetical protein
VPLALSAEGAEQPCRRVEIGVEALFGGHVHEFLHAGDRRVVAVGARLQQLVEFGVGGVGQAGRGDLVETGAGLEQGARPEPGGPQVLARLVVAQHLGGHEAGAPDCDV